MTPAEWGLVAGSYLLGGIPFGVLAARLQGIDILRVGSRNIGATNVYRAVGPAAGLAVLVLDVGKGFFPAYLGAQWFGPETALLCGLAAVIGHSFSPYLAFRGGKAVATGLGMLLAVSPLAALAIVAIFVVVVAITGYVSLGSVLAACALPLIGMWLGDPETALFVYCLLALFIVYKHIGNLQRLVTGQERRLELRPKRKRPGEEPQP